MTLEDKNPTDFRSFQEIPNLDLGFPDFGSFLYSNFGKILL